MKKSFLQSPWFYVVLSLIHQCLIILPGEYPHLFPDSQGYFDWNPQRMPIYPFLLKTAGGTMGLVVIQILAFALAVGAFSVICRIVVDRLPLTRGKELFTLVGSLYFATNFELIQFSPTILTESLGISLFVFYFFAVLQWQESRYQSKCYAFLSLIAMPLLLVFLRPSFILVPAAVFGFLALLHLVQKNWKIFAQVCVGLLIYFGSIQSYAFWNRTRLGHVGISDIAQHQIIANYMARGVLMDEAFKPDTSPGLRAFGEAYAITGKDPALKDSQYSMFEQWQKMNPGKELYPELVLANRELLQKRPGGYFMASMHNLSTLIDGRASFNYYPIRDRDIPSKIYFWLQFVVDNIFCVLWFVALFYYVGTARRYSLFGPENLIVLVVAAQFFTIGFIGYSELRRQSIGVASIQMLFVLVMWTHLLNNHWKKKALQKLN